MTEVAEQREMTIGEHLEELRTRLIMGLVGLVVICMVTLYFGDVILVWLQQPLHRAQREAGLPAKSFGLNVTTGFVIWMKVGIVSGLVVASPWIMLQLWRFVESGLYQFERRAVLVVAPFSGMMTVLGVLFAYYIMLPVCLAFLITFAVNLPPPGGAGPPLVDQLTRAARQFAGEHEKPAPATPATPRRDGVERIRLVDEDPADLAEGDVWINRRLGELRVHFQNRTYTVPVAVPASLSPLIEIGQYINFVIFLTLGVVAAFQLPPLMLVAGWSGLISPGLLVKYRRYCVFGCFAVGTVLTPADPISMLVLALPLWGLFEFGLILMRIAARGRDGDDHRSSSDPTG